MNRSTLKKVRLSLDIATSSINSAINAVTVGLELLDQEEERRTYRKRRYVMTPADRERIRIRHGHQHILNEMRLQDTNRYKNYLRMSPEIFQKLLSIVGPSITKSSMGPTMPIDPSTKLALVIR